MSGKATVIIELKDGTSVRYEQNWSGGNPLFEGAEAERATVRVAEQVRASIEATHGKLPKGASF